MLSINPATKARMIAAHDRLLDMIESYEVVTPCAECRFFRAQDGGLCEKWTDVVPDDARAAGCVEWDEAAPF